MSRFVLCCLLASIFGKPCPDNAFFTYVPSSDLDYCVCSHGLECAGEACSNGTLDNLPSFQPEHRGYGSHHGCSCMRSHCTLGSLQHAAIVAVAMVVPTACTCQLPLQPSPSRTQTILTKPSTTIVTLTSAQLRQTLVPSTSSAGYMSPRLHLL
jgi:hypothetical protein